MKTTNRVYQDIQAAGAPPEWRVDRETLEALGREIAAATGGSVPPAIILGGTTVKARLDG